MQLFTIGVIELNEDATPKVDAIGQPIPTYTQADIESMARVLTGFAYPPQPGTTSYWGIRRQLQRRHGPLRRIP